jgi:hypothetical protein
MFLVVATDWHELRRGQHSHVKAKPSMNEIAFVCCAAPEPAAVDARLL